jgi:hypothetical protein
MKCLGSSFAPDYLSSSMIMMQNEQVAAVALMLKAVHEVKFG